MDREQPVVLVVEDDEDVRTLVGRAFRRAGYAVSTAVDVGQAMGLLRDVTPDAIITDVLMPGASGLELIEALRADPRMASIPILILSARDQPADVLAGYDQGADDYVTKPVELAVLVAKVEALLRRSSRGRGPGQQGRRRGTLAVFSRVKGGVGATTLAVAVAGVAAGMDGSACLLDLDVYPGVSPVLGVREPPVLADVPAAELDRDLPGLVVEAAPRLGLVTGRRSPAAGSPLEPEAVLHAVELLRAQHDMVVVDMPRAPEEWTRALVRASDVAFLVTGPQVSAAAMLDEGRRTLADGDAANLRVVVNRAVKTGLSFQEAAGSGWAAPPASVPFSEYLAQLGSVGWSAVAAQPAVLLDHVADLLSLALGSERAHV